MVLSLLVVLSLFGLVGTSKGISFIRGEEGKRESGKGKGRNDKHGRNTLSGVCGGLEARAEKADP